MSTTQLTGVVAHIVSHAVGVVNDKAALTQRLTSMGANVASRFSGLVTHVIFRRKPQATKEERLAEDQALWELYARIDKAAQPRYGTARTFVVEPIWIEACFSNQALAPEKPYLLLRPDPFLHLPRSKTPGSSAGKKRRRHVQQPKPVQKYDLDVGAFEFSSTQKMHDDEPLQSASLLRREGPYGLNVQTEICPGSADSVPAVHNDTVIDLTATRPSSAPSHLGSSSQAAFEPELGDIYQQGHDRLTTTQGLSKSISAQDSTPEGEYYQQQPKLGQAAAAGFEELAGSRSPLAGSKCLQQQQLQGAEGIATKSSLFGLPAGLALLHGARAQPPLAATPEGDAVRGHHTPAAASRLAPSALAQDGLNQCIMQQQEVAEQTTPLSTLPHRQRLPILSGLSGVQSPLCTPRPLHSPIPLHGLTLPAFKHASASSDVQKTPALPSRLSAAQRQPSHQTAWTLPPERQLAALDGSTGVGPGGVRSRVDSAAGARILQALSIPQLKATPAAGIGQSPLAFPRLSPAPAQPAYTPQFIAGRSADYPGRLGRSLAATNEAQGTEQQQCAGYGLTCTPLSRSSDAGACQPHAHASMQGLAARASLGFGSPVLIEDTPQDRHFSGQEKPEVPLKSLAVIPTEAPVAPSPHVQPALPNAASRGAPALATQHHSVSHAEGGISEPSQHGATAALHMQDLAEGESTKPPPRTGVAKQRAARRGRRRPKGSAAQQENAGAACQQAADPAEQRQPFASVNTAALDNADGSGDKTWGMKRRKSEQHASKNDGAYLVEEMLEPGTGSDGADGVAQEEGFCAKSGCQAASQHVAFAKRPAVLALSSVPDADAKAAAKAVKRLGGMRLCATGNEDHVTHLVMGSSRRTLKVLLAIAAGAWLLTPDWIAASAVAGMWLDEDKFRFETPFASAAARARGHAALGGQPLLAGRAVHIVKGAGAKQSHDGAVALTQIALAHGAKVTGLRQCDLCIVGQGATPPDCARCPVAVRESWLLDLAASFEVPVFSEAYDARQSAQACL